MSEQILDTNVTSTDNPQDFDQKVEGLIKNGYEFKMGEYISKGFDIFKKDIGGFIGFTLIYFLINLVLAFIPFLGSLASIAISAPLSVGYAIVARKISRGETHEFGDFFKGFDYFGQLFLGGLVSGIFVVIGIILCIIPGIYLGVAYTWTSFIIVFAGKEFWTAMETSRKVVSKNWFSFLGFFIVLFLINILGALALGVGLLVTAPASSIALYAAYDDIVGSN
jgi:uncharacterized membrane protein